MQRKLSYLFKFYDLIRIQAKQVHRLHATITFNTNKQLINLLLGLL